MATSDSNFDVLENCLTCHELGSGAKLNINWQVPGLFPGPWEHRLDSPLSLSWTSDHQLLGILVGRKSALTTITWQSEFDKMESAFRDWKHRHLSMQGGALIARALSASKLRYTDHVVPAPNAFSDRGNSTAWRFLWSDDRSSQPSGLQSATERGWTRRSPGQGEG